MSAIDAGQALDVLKQSSPIGIRMRAEIDAVAKAKKELVAAAYEESEARYERNRNVALGTLLAALLVALGSVLRIGRAIARPLGEAVTALERVAAGDLTAR